MNVLGKLLFNQGRKGILVLVSLIVAIAIVLVIVGLHTKASSDPSHQLYKVQKMTLKIVVTEEGVLQAKESEKIIPDIDSEPHPQAMFQWKWIGIPEPSHR